MDRDAREVSLDPKPSRVSWEEGMLVLSRKLSQQILIDSEIAITVVKIEGNHVRLGIEAPPGVSILREELVAREKPNGAQPANPVGRQGAHA
jgi:carbon storage regulator